MSTGHRCIRAGCNAVLVHPQGVDCRDDDKGGCSHAIANGWRRVFVRIEADRPGAHRVNILTQHAWLCPTDVERYLPADQRRLW